MRSQFSYAWLLLRRLLLIMGIYSIYRLLFVAFNYHSFAGNSPGQLLISFAAGLRFDIVAVIYVNASVILLHLLPFRFRNSAWYQKLLTWIFFIVNAVALFFAVVDLKWFAYVGKRMTFGILGTTGDMLDQLPVYLRDYWYLLIIYAVTMAMLVWVYQKNF